MSPKDGLKINHFVLDVQLRMSLQSQDILHCFLLFTVCRVMRKVDIILIYDKVSLHLDLIVVDSIVLLLLGGPHERMCLLNSLHSHVAGV